MTASLNYASESLLFASFRHVKGFRQTPVLARTQCRILGRRELGKREWGTRNRFRVVMMRTRIRTRQKVSLKCSCHDSVVW